MKNLYIRLSALALAILLLAGCAAAPGAAPVQEREGAAVLESAERFLRALTDGSDEAAHPAVPETEAGRLLADALRAARTLRVSGDPRLDGDSAVVPVAFSSPDPDALCEALGAVMQELLDARMEAAVRTDEVLAADLSLPPDLQKELGDEAMARCTAEPLTAVEQKTFDLALRLEDGVWQISDADALVNALRGEDFDALADELISRAAASLTTEPKHYVLPLDFKEGQAPDAAGFGVTEDPADVLALLERPEAQRLLKGKELMWRPDLELFPDSQIHYYLDETILVIVWQEVTAWACGTYAEVIVADGSQLGRKLAEDSFDSEALFVPSDYADQTKAVLVLGGDYYRYPGRYNGICVYEGQIFRFEPDSSDCCFVTDNGELLFTYRGQFRTQEECEAFIEEHHVRFSLCFGPVVIENGENVMPEQYRWGEIYDYYARALFGCREEGHYIALAVNARAPGYFHLVTLWDAVDALQQHGCTRAYALDGGQTATIVLGGEVLNTVQFGIEREMSDVVVFASALPSEVEK